MSIESEARKNFGLLIKRLRAGNGLNRYAFAELVGVERQVIVRMEHGVENPTRCELKRAIEVLKPAKEEKNILYDLLRKFSPRRRKRIKFHLHFSARVRRNHSRDRNNYRR